MAILKRSSLLSLLLLAAVVYAGTETYQLWEKGPWGLPQPATRKTIAVVEKEVQAGSQTPPGFANTKNVVDRNLFDPERGASRSKEAEVSVAAMQRIRSMVLLGTAILGSSRYAILEGPPDSGAPAAKNAEARANRLRLKQGDSMEGFKLSEVQEKKVVFTKGTSRVEVALDYFRKTDDAGGKAKTPAQTPPSVAPRVPRPPVAGTPAGPVAP